MNNHPTTPAVALQHRQREAREAMGTTYGCHYANRVQRTTDDPAPTLDRLRLAWATRMQRRPHDAYRQFV